MTMIHDRIGSREALQAVLIGGDGKVKQLRQVSPTLPRILVSQPKLERLTTHSNTNSEKKQK